MRKSTNIIAFITAFSLHLIIGGVLLMSVNFSLPKDKPKEAVSIIDATIINQEMLDNFAKQSEQAKRVQQQKIDDQLKIKQQEEAEKSRQQALIQKQKDDQIEAEKAELLREQLEAQRVENEKIAAAEALQAEQKKAEEAAKALAEKQKADAAAELAKQEAEKLAVAKAAKEKADKLAAEKAAKEKADKLAAEKAAKEKADKLAAEKAAKEKADKLAKQKAAKEAKRKAAAEKERLRQAELDRQMEAEFSDDFSSARSAKQLSEIAKYESLIRSKIGRYWKVDQSMSGRSCTLAIKLAPDGLVLSAKMSRGDSQLCASARRATLQSRTLPIPKDSEIATQFRDFDITLEPDL